MHRPGTLILRTSALSLLYDVTIFGCDNTRLHIAIINIQTLIAMLTYAAEWTITVFVVLVINENLKSIFIGTVRF